MPWAWLCSNASAANAIDQPGAAIAQTNSARFATNSTSTASSKIRTNSTSNSVATLQSFATFLVAAASRQVQATHPNLAINIQAAIGLVNLEKPKPILPFALVSGKWEGYDAEKLLDDQLYRM